LLRELKATVKKLMQAVKNTVSAIAEAMEKLRSSMLIFSYQLRHIGVGKHSMGKHVKAVKPKLERYAVLVQQIKDKSKERKTLLAEKKETPFYQIPKLHDLTRRITELKEQDAGMDAAELMDARLTVREEKERFAIDRVKAAYGEKYDPMMIHDSKRNVANLLHEEAEARSIRERLRQKQQ